MLLCFVYSPAQEIIVPVPHSSWVVSNEYVDVHWRQEHKSIGRFSYKWAGISIGIDNTLRLYPQRDWNLFPLCCMQSFDSPYRVISLAAFNSLFTDIHWIISLFLSLQTQMPNPRQHRDQVRYSGIKSIFVSWGMDKQTHISIAQLWFCSP